MLEGLGARAVEADVFNPAALTEAFAGAETVVNLLTRIPSAARALLYADGGDAWPDEDAPGATATAFTAEAGAVQLFAGDAVLLRFGARRSSTTSTEPGSRPTAAPRRPGRRRPRRGRPLAHVLPEAGRDVARRVGPIAKKAT